MFDGLNIGADQTHAPQESLTQLLGSLSTLETETGNNTQQKSFHVAKEILGQGEAPTPTSNEKAASINDPGGHIVESIERDHLEDEKKGRRRSQRIKNSQGRFGN